VNLLLTIFFYNILLLECWNGEPDKRPTINQVVERLKEIITKTNIVTENYQTELNLQSVSTDGQKFNPTNIDPSSNSDNHSLHGEMSHFIQNFNKMSTKEIETITLINENMPLEKNLNKIVNDIVNYIFKIDNEGKKSTLIKNNKDILDYFDNNNINSQEIYGWLLLINQNSSDFIFLLGYFYYLGIETYENNKKAFDLFINASEKSHTLAQLYVGICYQFGYGTAKDEKLAFKYYEKIANMGYASGLLRLGYCYNNGIGTGVNRQKAFKLYYQAANLGNGSAYYNLALMYENGEGVAKDYNKAIELYQQSENLGSSKAQNNLGIMYEKGEGVDKDYKKAFELYHKAANSGNDLAQYNLAVMYEYGKGTEKDINQAIYWYEKSAKQGNQDAQNELKKLRK
jgi:TPR repeat protein